MTLPNDSALLHVRAALSRPSTSSLSSRSQYSGGFIDEEELIRVASRYHNADKILSSKRERQQAVAGALGHGEEVLLQRIKDRLDRSGFQWPRVEITYADLSVERCAVTTEQSLPSLLSPVTSLLRGFGTRGNSIKAVDAATGVLKPGSFTLLLGPPGSGKSTLLKALSGRLPTNSSMTTVSGSIKFNGQTHQQFVVQRTAAYVDQVDKLIPTLTCRETLNFSETCSGASRHHLDALKNLLSWEAEHAEQAARIPLDDEADKLLLQMLAPENLLSTEWTLLVLGLSQCANTLVGDAMLRGVSGGEKRRVGVGEGLVTPAMVVLLDEASTGLDSASTLALTQSMRRQAKLLNSTIVMALLQPEPDVVAQFDDILLLGAGRVLWHGPTSRVVEHFASVGLRPLRPDQELSEFLMQVASPSDQPQLLPPGCQPLTAAQLSKLFYESQAGVELRAAATADDTAADEVALNSLDTRRQGAAWPVLLRACTKRLLKIEFKRNWEACAIRWVLAGFIALVMGLLFLQLPVSFIGGVNLLGMLFQALNFIQMLSLSTIEMTFEKRPVLFKQRDDLFYPVWVEWLPAVVLNVPVLLVDSVVFGLPLYFLVGFTPTAAAFLTFLIILFVFSVLADNLYRAYGSAAKVLSLAMGVGVCHGVVAEMLAGFVITPGSIPPYWYWFYLINPVAYAFRSMAVNELQQERWAVPSGAGEAALGPAILEFFEIDSSAGWVWGGVGVVASMAAVCAAVSLLAYRFNRLPENPAVISKQQQQDARDGSVVVESPPAASHIKQAGGAIALTVKDTSAKGTVAPAPCSRGVSIAFRELCYFVPDPSRPRQELQLLHGITGAFEPGRLTALMGSSGAGKTTLMDVIAGRKTAGRISGSIAVDGRPKEDTHFARLVGYVEQADIHAPLATVHEALQFSAALRLTDTGSSSSSTGRAAAVAAQVDEVLQLVELTDLAGRLVGTPGVDGLSTEQRKRLTIAVELVASPRALFMDEPTSGLDTRSAALIAGVMRQISRRQGVSVVATIHQPSSAIFAQFDELLLLKRGGQQVFFGPLGPGCSGLVDFFQAVPEAPRFAKGRNPAAWALDVVSGPAALLPGFPDMAQHYRSSSLAQDALSRVDRLMQQEQADSDVSHLRPPPPAGGWQQLLQLLQRGYRSYWRNPGLNTNRFIVTIAIALIVGSIELGKANVSKIHNARSVQNSLGALFMVVAALPMEVGFECMSGIARERVVFYRERASAAYTFGPYAAAQVLVEVTYISVQVLAYTLITFFLMQFERTAATFFYILLLLWLSCLVSFLTAQALVQVTPMVFIATTLYSVLCNLQAFTAGFTRPLPVTPKAWWPAYFLNPSYHSFMAIGTAVLGGGGAATIADPTGSGAQISVAAYVFEIYGMGSRFPGQWGSLGMLALLGAVFCSLSCIGLRFASFQRR